MGARSSKASGGFSTFDEDAKAAPSPKPCPTGGWSPSWFRSVRSWSNSARNSDAPAVYADEHDAEAAVAQGASSKRLFDAADRGSASDVKAALEAGNADVNWHGEKGRTPLLAASHHGHEAVCLMLLRAGANVNEGNDVGVAPLHVAGYHPRIRTHARLPDAGA